MNVQVRLAVVAVALLTCLTAHATPAGAQSSTEIIVDNTQAEVVGTWTTSTYQKGYYGTNYQFRRAGTGANVIVWRPRLVAGGDYDVYYRLPSGSADRAPDAPFSIQHTAGVKTILVDQRPTSLGDWRLLGRFPFVAGSTGFVALSDRAGGTYVIADAVKFIPTLSTNPLHEIVVDNRAASVVGAWSASTTMPHYQGSDYFYRVSGGTGANSVRWTPELPEAGRYFVYYRLPDGAANRAPDAPFAVISDAGTRIVHVDQRQASNGEWQSLGSFVFSAGASGYVTLSDTATGTYVIADAIKFVRSDHVYTVRVDLPRQTILGFGVEIQSDSIGSGNVGLPEKASGVPHDLTETERTRFYNELLKGFRYVRLAMGLYLRGLTPDRQNIVERYPGQMNELREMIQQSGIEGAAVEYWSPAPYWKSSDSFIGGSLKRLDDVFLSDFSDAVVRDLDYLTDNGIPVRMFSLQNEPKYSYNKTYSYTPYTNEQYYATFRHVAPKVRATYPHVLIHNDSQGGQRGIGSALIQADPAALSYVDAWTWHRIGADSTEQITNRLMFNSQRFGKPVFNNEFEYLSGGTSVYRMLNTAQSIMNWLTFENSPTWFWLHALKPTYNQESEGYGLGLWRPYDDDDYSKYPHIDKGHFDFIKTNWHAVAGFLKYLPWNSVRLHVDEGVLSANHRIMAWRSPAGKVGVALTNRTSTPYTFDIGLVGSSRRFDGHRYDAAVVNAPLGSAEGASVRLTVPSYSIEFWVEQ